MTCRFASVNASPLTTNFAPSKVAPILDAACAILTALLTMVVSWQAFPSRRWVQPAHDVSEG
jgi:hypothetical protein